MKLFYTNASAKEEIGKLESKIGTLEAAAVTASAEISRLTEELKNASESVATVTVERDEAISAFEASEKTAAAATAENATAQAKLVTFDDEVEKSAQAKFAGLGGSPVPASSHDESKGKADISALTGFAKVSAAFAASKK